MVRNLFIGMTIMISAGILSFSAFAGFSLPHDAYRMYELTGALNEAKSDGWAITFLFSDENDSCPVLIRQSIHIIKELSNDSLVVYCNPNNEEVSQCPAVVLKGLRSQRAGRTIPIAVVVSSDLRRIIDIVPGGIGDDRHLELLRTARQRIKVNPSLWDTVKSKCQNLFE